MRPLLIALALVLAPLAAAQVVPDAEPPGAMERGLRLFLDGLRDEVEPGLQGLGDMARDAAPLLRGLQERLGSVVEDLDAYAAPEVLPNGDILIRRKTPLAPPPGDAPLVEPNPDGTLDL